MISPRTGQTVSASSWFATNTLQEGRYNRRELSQRAFLNFTEAIDIHNVSGVIGYEEIYTRATEVSPPRSDLFHNHLTQLSTRDPGPSRTSHACNYRAVSPSACLDD